jgi:hypothetical protein
VPAGLGESEDRRVLNAGDLDGIGAEQSGLQAKPQGVNRRRSRNGPGCCSCASAV